MEIDSFYKATSSILRTFSYSKETKKIYRSIGNIKNRLFFNKSKIKSKYPFNAKILFETINRFEIEIHGSSVLEMGTGWVHWDALILRNIAECEISLYDVWDNRSFNLFLNYCRQLSNIEYVNELGLEHIIDTDLMKRITFCDNLDSAYSLLNFRYFLEGSGLLSCFENESFNFVRSNAVFEHLRREDVPTILKRNFEVTKPGGWSVHLVSLADHLSFYAKRAHQKEFLRFSREEYKRRFQNDVQYVNLLQIKEWVVLLELAGFDIISIDRIANCKLDNIEINDDWRIFSDEDLSCTVAQFVIRRPAT